MAASLKFDAANGESHFSDLMVALKDGFKVTDDQPPSDANCPGLAFLNAFVEHYTDANNYSGAQGKFDAATEIIANISQLLVIVKPPILGRLLSLLELFCRAESNHAQILKLNVIQVVLGCMKRNGGDSATQESGCHVLFSLATNDKTKKQIAKDGGVDVVLDSLRNAGNTASLILKATSAIRAISSFDGNMKLVAQRGAGDLMVRTMDNHNTEGGIQENCVWTILHMSLKNDTCEGLAKAGCARRLLDALKGFPGQVKIQQGAIWALCNLSENSKAREMLKKENAVEALLASSGRFPEDDLIQRMASKAVVNLSQTAAPDDTKTDPAIPTNEVPMVVKRGFLTKQGGSIKTWHKRWFVLDTHKVSYFKAQDEKALLGSFPVTAIDGVMEDKDKQFGMLVVTPGRTYRFFGSNKTEQQEWMTAFKAAKPEFLRRKAEAAKRAEESIPEDMRIPNDELEGFAVDWLLQELHDKPAYATIRAREDAEVVIAAIVRDALQVVLKTRVGELAHEAEPNEYVDQTKATSVLAQTLPISIDKFTAEGVALPPYGISRKRTSGRLNVAPRLWKEEGWGDIGVRKSMEDRHVMIPYLNESLGLEGVPPMSYYAIFDGHGGVKCADYVAGQLVGAIARKVREEGVGNLTALIKKAFLETNSRFYQFQARKRIPDTCGATAVVVVVCDKTVYVCWAGDSEAALFSRDGSERHLCVVHKAGLDSERARIAELGGVVSEIGGVFRVNGSLAVTRAFGDAKHKKYVTAEPDVITFELDGTPDYLVLGCDGLWDVMRDSDVSEFIRKHRAENDGTTKDSAKALAKEAIARGSKDNVSTMVLTFADAAQ